MKILSWSVLVLLAIGKFASADTTYNFEWNPQDDMWFRFASHDWIDSGTPGDSWDMDVSATGVIDELDDTNAAWRDTPYADGGSGSGSTIQFKLIIEDITGTVDIADDTADWEFTAVIEFKTTDGVISAGSCKTSEFDIDFDGSYSGGTYGVFNIPALSGTGTQACATHASDINDDLALGGDGAEIHFNKMLVTP